MNVAAIGFFGSAGLLLVTLRGEETTAEDLGSISIIISAKW